MNSLSDRLAEIDNASLCDANKRLRVMDSGIRSVNGVTRIIGRALTISCRGDFLTVIHALSQSKAGDVLVIDGGAGTVAISGGLFATEGKRRGLAGIIVDGACRDTPITRKLDFPYYARSVTPMAGTARELGEVNTPITCGGVEVLPGEIIAADSDGIIVLSDEELEAALPTAEEIQRTETRVIERLNAGDSLFELMNAEDHIQAVKRGDTDSALKFEL